MLLDSSALIAFINPEDTHNSIACQKIGSSHSIYIHEVSLAESLVRAQATDTVPHVLHVIKSLRATVVSSSGIQGAIRIASIRHRTGLALPDCYVIDASRENESTIFSFDSKLTNAAQALGLATVFSQGD